MRKINATIRITHEFGEWQLCPKCYGSGQMIANGYTSTVMSICDVCNGAKILARPILK